MYFGHEQDTRSSLLTEVDETTKLLHEELAQRLEKLRAEGMVDLKVTVNQTLRSRTSDWLWVLNNVLRLREEGHFETTVLEAPKKEQS